MLLRFSLTLIFTSKTTNSMLSHLWHKHKTCTFKWLLCHWNLNFTKNDLSDADEMLQHLKWRNLEDRCRNACLVMMYKISHDTRRQSVKVTGFRRPWGTSVACTFSHIRSHYVGHNREKHHCRLLPYLRLHCWVTRLSPSGLQLLHLIFKFTPVFCTYFWTYFFPVIFSF